MPDQKPATCNHNAMVDNHDPQFAWKCADCGHVYGSDPTPPDLMTVIAQGSMRAAALIAADKGITPDPAALTRALRDQITEGWREAANDALEACSALSEEHGRQSLNLACNLFAINALKEIKAL